MTGEMLFDAMSGIRDEYILEAADAPRVSAFPRRARRFAAAVAALFLLSVLLPNLNGNIARALQNLPVVGAYFSAITFREYHYEDDTHDADAVFPAVSGGEETAAVNGEIAALAERLISDFEARVADKTNQTPSALTVTYDVVTDNDLYYTLRVNVLLESADSYAYQKYFTIRKTDAQEVTLASLYGGADYTSVLSEEVLAQMEDRMAADSSLSYYIPLDDPEEPGDYFSTIAADQDFYFNDDANLVLVFGKGDIAPMYMGIQEFIIPEEITNVLSRATLIPAGEQ